VSVDYRLLHHFRVSQRREMASRGELSVLRAEEQTAGETAGERPARDDASLPATPAKLQGGQVLTHLLNEDR
jgi:hypothetical protein